MWLYYLAGTIAFAGVALYIFCSQLMMLRRFLKFGIRTEARKLSFTKLKDPGGDIEVPIIEFPDQHGEAIRVTLQWNLHNKKEFIRIIYDPANPQRVIPNYWTKYINVTFAIVLLIFALQMILHLANDKLN